MSAECPFCGESVVIRIDEGGILAPYATCSKCDAEGPYAPGCKESEAIAAFTNPAHALAASRAECERLRVALEEIIKAWDHKTGDYYVDNYLSDVEIDAARAALAAQGGGT